MKQLILSLFSSLVVLTVKAQLGLGYNYILSSKKNSSSTTNLFADDGHSVNISFKNVSSTTWGWKRDTFPAAISKKGAQLGFTVDAGYQFGKTSQNDLTAFAKNLTAPLGHKISQSSTNWKQFVVMGGPMLRLGKRNNGLQPLEISAAAGAAFKLSPRTITIDKVDAAVPGVRVFNKIENETSLAWQVNLNILVARLGKRLNGYIQAGYGFNGGTIGITLRRTMAHRCPRCGTRYNHCNCKKGVDF